MLKDLFYSKIAFLFIIQLYYDTILQLRRRMILIRTIRRRIRSYTNYLYYWKRWLHMICSNPGVGAPSLWRRCYFNPMHRCVFQHCKLQTILLTMKLQSKIGYYFSDASLLEEVLLAADANEQNHDGNRKLMAVGSCSY